MIISPYLKRRILSIQLIIKLHVHIRILFLVRSNLLYWNRISWSPITECYYNIWNGVEWGVDVVARVIASLFIFLLLLLYIVSTSQITDCFSNGICVLTVLATWSQAVAMVNSSLRCGYCGQCNISFLLLCELLFQHRRPLTILATGFSCFWLFQQRVFKQQQ